MCVKLFLGLGRRPFPGRESKKPLGDLGSGPLWEVIDSAQAAPGAHHRNDGRVTRGQQMAKPLVQRGEGLALVVVPLSLLIF